MSFLRKLLLVSIALFGFVLASISTMNRPPNSSLLVDNAKVTASRKEALLTAVMPETLRKLLAGAKAQIGLTRYYDPAYRVIAYPNGDVPVAAGVCTDVVIRAFRSAGIDLQRAVHEDMVKHFNAYPHKWGLKAPDTNIDHRRVPNLQTFFARRGASLPLSNNGGDYHPGDIVTWDLDGKGLAHIGLVSDIWSASEKRFLIVHNIGAGAQAEDRLFAWKITGHYRYF